MLAAPPRALFIDCVVFTVALGMAAPAHAEPQNQSVPEHGTGDPHAQDEQNNDKPTGTGEETAGDPVEISTGAFAFSKNVLEVPGRDRNLSLTLSYVSNAQGIETQTGARWTHDLEERIMVKYTWGTPPQPYPGPADPGIHFLEGGSHYPEGPELYPLTLEVYHFHDLRVDFYSHSGGTDWTPTSGQFTKLISENVESGPYEYPIAFKLRHPNGTIVDFPAALREGGCGTYTFRAGSTVDREGNQVTLNYESVPQASNCPGGEGPFYRRLSEAVDTLGRVVEFDYDAAGWLDTITDHTGRVVDIDHDADGNIIAITTPSVTVFPPDTSQSPYAACTKFGYPTTYTFPHEKHNIQWISAPLESSITPPTPYVQNTWDITGEQVKSQVIGGTNGSNVSAGGVHSFLYEVYSPPTSYGWFDCARRTLSVNPDGHAELHYFDESWRPRLVYRFTGGLDPSGVATGQYTIDDLVLDDPALPSTAAQLIGVQISLPSVGSSPGSSCLWTRTDYTNMNLPSVEVTQDSRTEYYYDELNLDRFQKGNLLALKRKGTSGGEIVHAYAYEPLFNQPRLVYDPRAFGGYIPPSGGTNTPERYAEEHFFDYQEGAQALVQSLVDDWGIDLGQSTAISFLGPSGLLLNVSPIAFGSDLNGNNTPDGLKGNVVRESRTVTIYQDPQAATPTFQTITESTTTEYNAVGLPTIVTDPGQFKTFFEYYATSAVAPQPGAPASASSGGFLAMVSRSIDMASSNLVTVRFGYDAVGRVNKVRNARGYDTTKLFDEMDRCVLSTDATGTNRGALYDANGNLVEELAGYSTPAMTSTGLPSGIAPFPRFIRTRMRYDMLDNVVTREVQNGTSSAPSTVQYRYTKAGSRVLTLYPEWTNDNRNLQATVFDEFGRQWTSTAGGITAQFSTLFANQSIPGIGSLLVEVAGVTATEKQFYEMSRMIKARDEEGNDTAYQYDGFNRVTKKTTPIGHYEIYAYDQASQQIRVETFSNGGALLSYAVPNHDERGQVFEVRRTHISAAGTQIGDGISSTRFAFDARGLCGKVVDDNNNATVSLFDGLGRETRRDDAVGNYSVSSYDKNSNLIYKEMHETESDAPATVRVRRAWAFHDSLDRETATVDELGRAIRTRYDTLGRVVFTSDARSAAAPNVQLSSLDSPTNPQHSGLPPAFLVNSHGNTTWFTYDDAGYQLSTLRHMRVSGLGGNALLSGGAGAITTSSTYDLNGRLTGQIDDKGNLTSYRYDSLNRRDRVTYADQTQWNGGYFKHGRIKWCTDPNGTQVEYSYDADGRLDRETVTPGANVLGEKFAEYDYDALGRLTLAQNSGATVTREYDTLSQLTAEVLNGKRTELRNDGGGRLLGYTYPSAHVLNYTRDAIGRLRTIRQQGASTDIAVINFSGVDTVKSRVYFNGTTAAYTYDLALQALDVAHALGGTNFSRRSSTWDRQGNRVTRQDPITSPVRTFTYTYDSVARMVQSGRTGGGQAPETIQYALDDVGNRTSVTGGPDAGAYTLNPGHAPLNLYSTTPSGASAYHASSSLQSRANGTSSLSYDYRERLVQYHDVSANRLHLYFYDALGRRFKKVTDSGTAQEKETRYFFDGGWNAIEERNNQDAVVARYVYEDSLDSLVEAARDPSGSGTFTTHWVHADDQRNVLALTNGAGAVVEKYEYRDYGQTLDPVTMLPLASSVVGNARLFSGREYDWETGLYEFRHRYLDPRTGRFVSRDPIGVWGDSNNLGNGQSYCNNNPASLGDPLGLHSPKATAVPTDPKRGDCRTGSTDREGVKGDTRTGSSDPKGVKGDCKSQGSVSGKKSKSGRRLSDGEYQNRKRASAAAESAPAGSASREIFYCLAESIQDASSSTKDSADQKEIFKLIADSRNSGADLPFETSSGPSLIGWGGTASTGVEAPNEGEVSFGTELLSDGAEAAPGTGQAMAVYTIWTGENYITDQPSSRGWAVVGLIPGAKGVVKVVKYIGKGVKQIAKGARRLFKADVPGGHGHGSKALDQITPTGKFEVRNGQHVNDHTGRVEPWEAHYDQFGRQVERTDFNAANKAHGIPSVHHHTREYGPSSYNHGVDKGKHSPGVGPRSGPQ